MPSSIRTYITPTWAIRGSKVEQTSLVPSRRSPLCIYNLVGHKRQNSNGASPGPGLAKYAAKYALGFLRPSYFYPIASGPADLHLLHMTGAQRPETQQDSEDC
ncbi:hypothetical protein F2Q70_00036039 [Brassica cretica]|uniref:Uncharacterized protein n=1 Tax=Brassica cretica TaxID=69181 RepID=A0A8S9JZD0_BRACR|nr:hypothetical protein F2Q70_00036039 [Brassica cretica]